jgi:hypothetical protein
MQLQVRPPANFNTNAPVEAVSWTVKAERGRRLGTSS